MWTPCDFYSSSHSFRRACRESGNAEELKGLLLHAISREFPHLKGGQFETRIIDLVRAVAERHAFLSAQWLRVGYVQGNMNSDNCLLR